MELMNIPYKTYKGELSNELVELNSQYRVDSVLDFEDYIVNMEFFSSPLTNKNILQCLIYSVLLHKREKRPTISVIICTSGKRQNITIPYFYSISDSFNPIIIDNSKSNGWEKLNNIKEKIKNNEKLNQKDIITLCIISTYNSDKPKANLIIEGINVLNKANLDDEDKIIVKSIQFALSDKFIKNKEYLKQIWSENMEIGVFEYVKEEGKIEGIEEGIEKGIEKGIKKGERKNAINVARKLLNKELSVEEVCEITELTTEQVISLRNAK